MMKNIMFDMIIHISSCCVLDHEFHVVLHFVHATLVQGSFGS